MSLLIVWAVVVAVYGLVVFGLIRLGRHASGHPRPGVRR